MLTGTAPPLFSIYYIITITIITIAITITILYKHPTRPIPIPIHDLTFIHGNKEKRREWLVLGCA